MKYGKLVDMVKSGNIVIPVYIYKEFPNLGIDLESFIFLMFLNGKGNNQPFDINRLSEEYMTDIKTIMNYISKLQSSNLIEIKVIKNEKNIMEEFISLDSFYEKIALLEVGEISKKEQDSSDIFSILEKELGKTLTPMETEIVKAWKESNYTDEVIKDAIKEAVINGVANLRYIDKILYEWAKKGIKTHEDVEKNNKEFREKENKKSTALTEEQKKLLEEIDTWMDENEEE